MATRYEKYYNKYMRGMNDNLSAYDDLAKSYAASVDQDAQNQISDATKTAEGQLRQAYITRMQDQRTLNNNLATAGIRGGATETASLNLANQYGNTRNSINSNLASSITGINRTAAQNKLAYQQDIDAKKQAYIENRQSEARQAAREDLTNYRNRKDMLNQRQYERGQTKRQQRIEKYTAQYSKYFSVKQLKKLLKSKSVKNNALAKQVINARIGYLRSPEYKNAKR